MYHFFVEPEQISEKEIRITGSDVNHIRSVLRMKPGEEILISSRAGGDYHCAVEEIGQDEVRTSIMWKEALAGSFPAPLCYSRGSLRVIRWKWSSRKTWNWVSMPCAVAMQRCVVKLDEKKPRQTETVAADFRKRGEAGQAGDCAGDPAGDVLYPGAGLCKGFRTETAAL